MQKVVEIESLFNRIKMLQKTFSLIREGRIKASDFPSRTDELVQAIKEDVVTPAVHEVEKRCDINASSLQDYSNQLQECCTQTEYYIPTGIRTEVPTPPTVTDALIDACNLQSEEAAHELFVKYIFIIDERNEIASRLESELARLKERRKQDAEAERLEREQEKERERLEKEQERKERQKEQAELVKNFAEMVNKQKETPKQDTPSEEAGQQGEVKHTYSKKLVDLFYGHVDYIDKLIGLPDKEIAAKIHKWSELTHKEDSFPICKKVHNNKSAYAEALKENGLITVSKDWFRQSIL